MPLGWISTPLPQNLSLGCTVTWNLKPSPSACRALTGGWWLTWSHTAQREINNRKSEQTMRRHIATGPAAVWPGHDIRFVDMTSLNVNEIKMPFTQPRVLEVSQGTFTLDQFQISPAALPEILHHTVGRTWILIAYSDESWLYCQFSLRTCTFLLGRSPGHVPKFRPRRVVAGTISLTHPTLICWTPLCAHCTPAYKPVRKPAWSPSPPWKWKRPHAFSRWSKIGCKILASSGWTSH